MNCEYRKKNKDQKKNKRAFFSVSFQKHSKRKQKFAKIQQGIKSRGILMIINKG